MLSLSTYTLPNVSSCSVRNLSRSNLVDIKLVYERYWFSKINRRIRIVAELYRTEEQQLRFAFLQSGQVFIVATGGIVNFGVNSVHLLRIWLGDSMLIVESSGPPRRIKRMAVDVPNPGIGE